MRALARSGKWVFSTAFTVTRSSRYTSIGVAEASRSRPVKSASGRTARPSSTMRISTSPLKKAIAPFTRSAVPKGPNTVVDGGRPPVIWCDRIAATSVV